MKTYLSRVVDPISRICHTIGAGILFLMMLITAVDVCLRYFFGRPMMGAYELTELMMIVIVFLGMAYTAVCKRHISVNIVFSHLSKRVQNVIDSAINLVGTGFYALITWQTTLYVHEKMMRGDASEVLLIPKYPIVGLAAFGSALLTLVFLGDLVKSLSRAFEKRDWQVWMGLTCALGVGVMCLSSPVWAHHMPYIDPLMAGAIAMGVLLMILFSGMYVGLAMGLIGFMGLVYVIDSNAALSTLGATPFHAPGHYSLSTVPLFILMGMFAYHSGISRNLYQTTHKWLGHLPGGLAMATVGGCAGFAAISGSSMATAATMGTMALPEMKKYKYNQGLATGCIAAGGTIGSMIPPSTGFIIYAFLTEQSIGKLFLAGMFPGLLEALIYICTIFLICKINPTMGPPGPKTSFKDKLIALKNVWAVVVLFVSVLGGLYFGVFTPTEAAGIGAFGALLLSLITRQLNWSNFVESLEEAAKTTAMIFFIVIGAKILGFFLAATRLPFVLADIIGGLPVAPWVSFGIIILMYIILGCFMDTLAMVLLTIPIFYPVVVALGYDPIWFGVIHLKTVEIGLITPPIGINLFVISGIAKDIPQRTIYKGVIPFVIADLAHLGLLLTFPAISLFLPSHMR